MNKKGFTLTELLIVLLIISIIMVIAVPAAVGLLDDIEMSRLNSSAKVIFLSSQHEFIYLDTADSLYRINDISSEAETLRYIVLTQETPFPKTSSLLRVTDGTSALIEYAPESASIAAVFFSETMSAAELEEAYLTENLTDPTVRRALRIGYYGDEPITKPPREHALTPKITVRNGEELWLEVVCDDIPEAEADSLDVQITLKNGHITAMLTTPEVEVTVIDGTLTARILLDTMQPYGIPFAVRFSSFGFSDITAAAKITYRGKNGDESTPDDIMQKTSVTFNPLFESADGDNITVSRVRHLNNLRYIDTAPVSVTQTQDIAFKGVPASEFFYNHPHEPQLSPIPEFVGLFNGGDFLIKNLSLALDGAVTGLFAEVSGELKNIHLTGTAHLSVSETAGTLCEHLTETGRIENCSVSEITIEAPSGATVGGLVGICEGEVTHCSAVLDDITLGADCAFGGIVGKLNGGIVTYSHSAGKISSAESSSICGIASGYGTVKNCYSECTTAYNSGSDFYGVSTDTLNTSDSFYILENAWLALDTDRGAERENIVLAGFDTPLRAVVDSASYPVYTPLPESVTQNGVATRFGASVTHEPRGLIGLVEVAYDGESYSYTLRYSFDAYGNDSLHHPAVTWDSPIEGETRVYVFRSDFASPENGASGWEWTTDGNFGADEIFGGFICKQVTDAEKVVLRFGDIKRVSEFQAEESVLEGVVGVIAVLHDFIFDTEASEHEYVSSYCYIDLEDSSVYSYEYGELSGGNYNDSRLLDLESFTFESYNYGEIRIYVFSTSTLSPEKDWTAVIDTSEITETVDYEPYTLYEFFRGDRFDPLSVEIDISNGMTLKVLAEFQDSMIGGFYSVPSVREIK